MLSLEDISTLIEGLDSIKVARNSTELISTILFCGLESDKGKRKEIINKAEHELDSFDREDEITLIKGKLISLKQTLLDSKVP